MPLLLFLSLSVNTRNPNGFVSKKVEIQKLMILCNKVKKIRVLTYQLFCCYSYCCIVFINSPRSTVTYQYCQVSWNSSAIIETIWMCANTQISISVWHRVCELLRRLRGKNLGLIRFRLYRETCLGQLWLFPTNWESLLKFFRFLIG